MIKPECGISHSLVNGLLEERKVNHGPSSSLYDTLMHVIRWCYSIHKFTPTFVLGVQRAELSSQDLA